MQFGEVHVETKLLSNSQSTMPINGRSTQCVCNTKRKPFATQNIHAAAGYSVASHIPESAVASRHIQPMPEQSGCLFAIFKLFSPAPKSAAPTYPYRKKESLLTPAER